MKLKLDFLERLTAVWVVQLGTFSARLGLTFEKKKPKLRSAFFQFQRIALIFRHFLIFLDRNWGFLKIFCWLHTWTYMYRNGKVWKYFNILKSQ